MKAKRNRYDLSLWDVRKQPLYGSAQKSVQSRNSFWVKLSRFKSFWSKFDSSHFWVKRSVPINTLNPAGLTRSAKPAVAS